MRLWSTVVSQDQTSPFTFVPGMNAACVAIKVGGRSEVASSWVSHRERVEVR
jgi:hypothetical protein